MKYGSVCSGIEAASAAWHPLGWQASWLSEIEPFPCSVLKHHYPDVPNLGDMTKWETWPDEPIDVLVGGTPCQPFSVAGKRGGMDDARGQLALSFSAIAKRYKPRWIVWENVPGVLSSGGGRDFGAFVQSLVELGYGVCWRVLDAQYFGVAQRRRRVFVVGHLGDWRRAAAVLFERKSLQRDSAKGGKARERIAGTLSSRTTAGGGLGTDFDLAGGLQVATATWALRLAACLETTSSDYSRADGFNMVAQAFTVAEARRTGTIELKNQAPTLTSQTKRGDTEPCVLAFAQNQLGEVRAGEVFNTINTNSNASGRNTPMVAFPANMSATQYASTEGVACNLQARNPTAIATAMQVRRLTPTECERLQGFPDGYTQVQHRGKPAADGPRYKALGNSMAVPVMAWIGRRIQMVEDLIHD
jgi:DNA (cytosine-5)-methyltransferase 1